MSPPTRYRRVRVRIWLEPAFRALKDSDRLIALYLLTGPLTNAVGLYRLSPATAAEDLGVPVAQFRRRLDVVLPAFGWRHEERSHLIWIPGWAEENAPQNPNIVRSWRSAFDELPDSPLKAEAMTAILVFLQQKGPAFAKAFGKPLIESVPESLAESFRNESGNAPDPVPDSVNHLRIGHDAGRLENAASTRRIVSGLRRRGLA